MSDGLKERAIARLDEWLREYQPDREDLENLLNDLSCTATDVHLSVEGVAECDCDEKRSLCSDCDAILSDVRILARKFAGAVSDVLDHPALFGEGVA